MLEVGTWVAQSDGEAISCTVDGFRLCLSKSMGVLVHDAAGWPLLVMGLDELDLDFTKRIEGQIGRVCSKTKQALSLRLDEFETAEGEALKSLVSRLGRNHRRGNGRSLSAAFWLNRAKTERSQPFA
jgi:hypothetical protein